MVHRKRVTRGNVMIELQRNGNCMRQGEAPRSGRAGVHLVGWISDPGQGNKTLLHGDGVAHVPDRDSDHMRDVLAKWGLHKMNTTQSDTTAYSDIGLPSYIDLIP